MVAFSIPSVPGEWFTSRIYGGFVLGFSEAIKSTAAQEPLIAFAANKHCSTSNSVNLYSSTFAPWETFDLKSPSTISRFMEAITFPPKTITRMSPSVLIYSWISKSTSLFWLYSNWTKDSIWRSDSINKTPTPLEPSKVFIIIGNLLSNVSRACFHVSSLGIRTVLGCVNPKSCSLTYVLYLSDDNSTVSRLFTMQTPIFSNWLSKSR